MKPNLFIRVNAAKNKGLGHWVRCTALADMLQSNFNCIFLLKTENEAIARQTKNLGFICHRIPTEMALMEEPDYMKINFLTGNEIIVLDSYDFSTAYQKVLKSMTGKVVSIDDIHESDFVSDVIINHSGGIKPSAYECAAHTQLLLGFDYLLLRKSFLNQSTDTRTERNPFTKVLICMGGEDPNNDTLKILQHCEQFGKIEKCEVIVGAGYRHIQALEFFQQHSPLVINVSQQLSEEKMSLKMQACSTAICSPSTTALEYLSLGGNLFLYQTADNQNNLNNYLLKEGLAFSWEELDTVTTTALRRANSKQQSMIDGKSPERLNAIFSALQNSMELNFRKARLQDMKQYFDWTNDADTRKQSFQSAPIPLDQHKAWFEGQLECPHALLLVMEKNDIAIGQIRFNLKGTTATISYSIAKNARGHGYAKPLIAGGIDFLKKQYSSLLEIEGFVKVNNIPSIKVFQRLGFLEERVNNQATQIKYIQKLKQAS